MRVKLSFGLNMEPWACELINVWKEFAEASKLIVNEIATTNNLGVL